MNKTNVRTKRSKDIDLSERAVHRLKGCLEKYIPKVALEQKL